MGSTPMCAAAGKVKVAWREMTGILGSREAPAPLVGLRGRAPLGTTPQCAVELYNIYVHDEHCLIGSGTASAI